MRQGSGRERRWGEGRFYRFRAAAVIFGTGTVNKVYDEFIRIAGIGTATKEEVKQAASAKTSVWKRAIKSLGDVFVPIIPAIVASGLLMGLLEGMCKVYPQLAESGTYTIIHLFSNAAFVFLPVLIAFSAAKVFGGNPFLGAVIGMIRDPSGPDERLECGWGRKYSYGGCLVRAV